MRFDAEFKKTPVCRDFPEIDIDYLAHILRGVSWQVGDEMKARLHAAIDKSKNRAPWQDGRISFRDTPVFGHFYVYLWFDLNGNLFYIGKGTGNRAVSLQGRSAEFKEKAASGYYKILADDMAEGYALDLEKILLLEIACQRTTLTNHMYGDAVDAIQYCTGDRDALLYYWNHLGVISRFSELTGVVVHYDARNCSLEALDERWVWWETYRDVKVNDPTILAEIRAAEERKKSQKEKQREYARRRKEKMVAREKAG